MPRPLRIVIPGGTGVLGSLLAHYFHSQGHILSTITRFPKPGPGESVHWDAETIGHWAASLEDADLIINLTASSNPQARVRTTALLAQAVSQSIRAPRLWINLSTSDPDPSWEAAVYSASTRATRKILLRLATVMSPHFGLFPRLLRLVRWGFGGEIGNGGQYVGWLHDADFLRAIEFLARREDIDGPIHLTAPDPIPNHQFMSILRDSWSAHHFGLPIPAWLAPAALLKSHPLLPEFLLEAGFNFRFPEWQAASENLVQRWRQRITHPPSTEIDWPVT
jgi:NAD dependent epimerase/dehydratase family enzyme